ncbi:unnamed protein product [Mycena citricolor]|uniref:Uncharacterized protein n=1 Tax=Mycena citricolor TaxID=2018698 RepID=A0AAD2H5Y4_9AGAR|nr:unnamed protein product [Mycena citricolor]
MRNIPRDRSYIRKYLQRIPTPWSCHRCQRHLGRRNVRPLSRFDRSKCNGFIKIIIIIIFELVLDVLFLDDSHILGVFFVFVIGRGRVLRRDRLILDLHLHRVGLRVLQLVHMIIIVDCDGRDLRARGLSFRQGLARHATGRASVGGMVDWRLGPSGTQRNALSNSNSGRIRTETFHARL